MSSFASIPKGVVDPMFILKARADSDTHPAKIDLGVGVYRSEQGGYYEFPAIKKAKHILERKNLGHEHNPTTGIPSFPRLSASFLFGDSVEASRIASIQTVAGTGANRLAATFLNAHHRPQNKASTAFIGTPSWGNYMPLFTHAGVPTKKPHSPGRYRPHHVNRCTRIWWTVYILESKITASIGVPNAIRDQDVTATLWDPKYCSQSAAGLSLHVKVSQVMAHVLHTVYSPGEGQPTLYLEKVRSALRRMASISSEWEAIQTRFKNSVDTVSGLSTRLNLSYNLCVIIIIRPLIFSLLLERLDFVVTRVRPRPLFAPVQSLVQTCVDSAVKSLKILTVLREKHLLETFLPFDLEYAFASIFVLRLVSVIAPDELQSVSWTEAAKDIFEDLILRGNRIAQFRQAELDMLERVIEPFAEPGQEGSRANPSHPVVGQHLPPQHHGPDAHSPLRPSDDSLDPALGMGDSLSLGWGNQAEGVDFLSELILSVVNQLTVDDLLVDENLASLGAGGPGSAGAPTMQTIYCDYRLA